MKTVELLDAKCFVPAETKPAGPLAVMSDDALGESKNLNQKSTKYAVGRTHYKLCHKFEVNCKQKGCGLRNTFPRVFH